MMKEEIEENKIDIETRFLLITDNSPEELNERLDILQYLFLYFSEFSKDKLKNSCWCLWLQNWCKSLSRIEMLKAEKAEEEFDTKTSFLPAAPSNEEDLHEG